MFMLIILGPESVNVSINSSVLFSCTAIADSLLFYVNGTSASNSNIEKLGFALTSESVVSDELERNLTLSKATANLNYTEIFCRAKGNGGSNDSDIALLLIQGILYNMVEIMFMLGLYMYIGLLNAVVSLNYNFVNSTSLNITWSAPYTLDGVDILGYNITITDADTVLCTHFTKETQYVIYTDDVDPCTKQTLTVSGYNQAGDGDASSLMFYYQAGKVLPNYSHDMFQQ